VVGVTIETERLVLRPWRDEDRAPFAALNADPRVMAHFPATLTRAESDAFVDRHAALIDRKGWGLWALERRCDGSFLGFTGLAEPFFDADFMPCVEVGWRLAAEHWGEGYAPEAARAALDHGFDIVGLDEIVSFTAVGNENSRRVMEKVGLIERHEFDHPVLPDHPLQRHVLYSIRAEDR
jgi:RimJ/RimL family protein N-acetyltransferase